MVESILLKNRTVSLFVIPVQYSLSYTKYVMEKHEKVHNRGLRSLKNMAARELSRSLIIDLLESPNGTLYAVLIASVIVILTTGLFYIYSDNQFILEIFLLQ